MINKLLVALDGSNHSLKAVDYASETAASLKAKLIILNVVKTQELPESLREYAELEHVEGTDIEVLKKVAGHLVANAERRAKEKGVDDIVGEVEEGPVARTIIARAQHHDVDMIVVGFPRIRQHRSDSSRWRLAPCRALGQVSCSDGQITPIRLN